LVEQVGETEVDTGPHAYFVAVGEPAEAAALAATEHTRDRLPGLRVVVNCGGGGFKSQMKRADRSGARIALILGEDELARDSVTIKSLREDTPQEEVPDASLVDALLARFGESLLN
jgi:histidyl-tRNA synthetase